MVKANNVDGVLERISGARDRTSVSDSHNPSAENETTNAKRTSPAVLTMVTLVPEIIQTLPDSLNSLIGQSIDIETDHPQEVIGLLGRKLGIDDYRTNLASFWLLDTMAFEVLRIEEKMNSVNLAIMISWIAGEAKLIQAKQFSRGKFFQEMGLIFEKVSDQLSEGRPMMYWEEIIGIDSSLKKQSEFQEDEQEEFPSSQNSELSPSDESAEHKNFEVVEYDVEKIHSRHSSSVSQKSDPILASSMKVLEAIVESTYVMYANAFHYESVSAAFAQPIELHSYRLPYTLRLPRPVQIPVLLSVKTEARNAEDRGKTRSKTDKGKPGKKRAGKERGELKSSAEISPPPPSMTDEEMIAQKRKHILPLMESNEAPRLLEQFAQPQSINLTSETKLNKKSKRRT